MTGSFTSVPSEYRVLSPPPEVMIVWPVGGRCATSRRQAITRLIARIIEVVGRLVEKLPIADTEKLPVLNPCVAALTTGTVIPPDRPSYTRPNLSTRKL